MSFATPDTGERLIPVHRVWTAPRSKPLACYQTYEVRGFATAKRGVSSHLPRRNPPACDRPKLNRWARVPSMYYSLMLRTGPTTKERECVYGSGMESVLYGTLRLCYGCAKRFRMVEKTKGWQQCGTWHSVSSEAYASNETLSKRLLSNTWAFHHLNTTISKRGHETLQIMPCPWLIKSTANRSAHWDQKHDARLLFDLGQ